MSDLFHDRVPLAFVDDVFDVMQRADHHIFQVLTKRPERLLSWHRGHGSTSVPAHIWLGVSIESERYLQRLDPLRAVNVPVRFISAEPLLGPLPTLDLTGISWVITGGESGGADERALVTRGAKGWYPKPEALAWIREIRDTCKAQGVAFFHKQWGGPSPKSGGRSLDRRMWDEMPAMSTPRAFGLP